MTATTKLRLGLIGDNIARSRSPLLHRLAGDQNGVAVTYDPLVPKVLGETFEQVFARCQNGGYRGINVTYPYKEHVVPSLRIDDPLVRAIGAANTVVFEEDGPVGYNTDYSGFVAAYKSVRQDADTGPVLMIGTGGVGRAVAFGLVALGTKDLRLVDRDMAKAEVLAEALRLAAPDMQVTTYDDPTRAAEGAAGLINCTPVGMVGYEGTPLPRAAMAGAEWAFDAVYTPVETQFLQDAFSEDLSIISGWNLFFFQGVHAWHFFTGLPLNEAQLRDDLLQSKETS
ncbi:shikimate dehydrogenase family protein [Actibacterium lipolyticum]|uniref:Quinate/shikimate dehydrogenase n=1 Tax=Actibacterium lipolyticum TaxID=1524263 RepID=A0A238KK83_9RHOB|nr:shikimate dehydrogenase [Actibacterium lipolyticum]SMX43130.1 Quinate/shikimate dehydrogenase [Actibacterium lipolyticum]